MADQTLTFTLDTGDGEDRNVVIKLRDDLAPNHVKQITDLAKEGFYDGVVFHRVIPGFMVQGGGFEPGMKQKSVGAPIKNEAGNGLRNDNYAVAMARTSDPHSATAQFFINVADNSFLNHTAPTASGWGYAVFGRVVEGAEVVDKIAGTKTTSRMGHADVPREDVVLEKAVVQDAPAAAG